jgi:hypothetical protein
MNVRRVVTGIRPAGQSVVIGAGKCLGHDSQYLFSRLASMRSGWSPNRYPFDSENWFRGGRIFDDLKHEPEDVVIFKPLYGAYYDTPLQTILHTFDVTRSLFAAR